MPNLNNLKKLLSDLNEEVEGVGGEETSEEPGVETEIIPKEAPEIKIGSEAILKSEGKTTSGTITDIREEEDSTIYTIKTLKQRST